MKKLWIIAVCVFLLSGCTQPESLETVADPVVTPEIPEPMVAVFKTPLEAVQQTIAEETAGQLYICDGYTLTLQTVPGGNLQETLQNATGFLPSQLEIIQTRQGSAKEYQFVWTSASDTGEQLCRGSVLDDGSYHYVLTAMAPYETAGALSQSQWQEVFSSFRLMRPEDIVSSGS